MCEKMSECLTSALCKKKTSKMHLSINNLLLYMFLTFHVHLNDDTGPHNPSISTTNILIDSTSHHQKVQW